MSDTSQDQLAVSTSRTLRIIKIGECASLSGKSRITYHIGVDAGSMLYFRIAGCDGGGFFNADWISFGTLMSAIADIEVPLTSFALRHLFSGKSTNSPGFMFAALMAEGLVMRNPDQPRTYLACPVTVFQAEMDVLLASNVRLSVPEMKRQAPVLKAEDVLPAKSKGRSKK